jgi:phosphate transport system ATP-binding protein
MTTVTDKGNTVRRPGGLSIDGLEVSYGLTQVLKGINLTIQPGQVTAIIGPSGCGKTTLLRSLNRLSEVTPGCQRKGAIYLDGEEIHDLDPMLLRRRVGMVFQRPNPFPMSIRENVLYGVRATHLRVDADATVTAALARAAIWDEVKDRLHSSALALSLGQQQRVCIARTLAVQPEVILMDEPAAALDPASTARVEETIGALRGDYTIVIVTHNMQQALRVSDRTAFLLNGELIEYGETEQLFGAPRSERTDAYVNGRFG